MSLPDKAFPVSWDQFHRDARALAWRLAGLNKNFRGMVCITRGGLVPAAIISRELNIRLIETVSIATRHDYVNQGETAVLKTISSDLLEGEGEGLLVTVGLSAGLVQVVQSARTGRTGSGNQGTRAQRA